MGSFKFFQGFRSQGFAALVSEFRSNGMGLRVLGGLGFWG